MNQEENYRSPIFIGGAGRSGTTLLRVILDSHPNIACGPEIKLTPMLVNMCFEFQRLYATSLKAYYISPTDLNKIFASLFMSFVHKYQEASGKKRFAEKTPHNVFFFKDLAAIFPQSPLIHVIRDGRDVVCSLLKMDWIDLLTGEPADYTRDVRKAAGYWVQAVRTGRDAQYDPIAGPNYMETRYEDLIETPEPTLRKLFQFIQEPWDPIVLYYYQFKRNLADESSAHQVSQPLYKSAMNRWINDLKPNDKEIIKEVAGSLLIELGYAHDFNW